MAIPQLPPPLWSGLKELKNECSFRGATYVLIIVPVGGWAQVLIIYMLSYDQIRVA